MHDGDAISLFNQFADEERKAKGRGINFCHTIYSQRVILLFFVYNEIEYHPAPFVSHVPRISTLLFVPDKSDVESSLVSENF